MLNDEYKYGTGLIYVLTAVCLYLDAKNFTNMKTWILSIGILVLLNMIPAVLWEKAGMKISWPVIVMALIGGICALISIKSFVLAGALLLALSGALAWVELFGKLTTEWEEG